VRRFWTLRTTILIAAIFLIANPTVAEKVDLALQWQKTFEKNVSWYVRTSTGILLAKSRKNLTAIDGENGQVLWELPDVFGSEGLYSALSDMPERGRNVLEVPGMGVLLLNRVKQAGHSEGRLLALNLATGARLCWFRDGCKKKS
jgi:outer membrane protein assembly factor BamB